MNQNRISIKFKFELNMFNSNIFILASNNVKLYIQIVFVDDLEGEKALTVGS